jgi:hypothetical protein
MLLLREARSDFPHQDLILTSEVLKPSDVLALAFHMCQGKWSQQRPLDEHWLVFGEQIKVRSVVVIVLRVIISRQLRWRNDTIGLYHENCYSS